MKKVSLFIVSLFVLLLFANASVSVNYTSNLSDESSTFFMEDTVKKCPKDQKPCCKKDGDKKKDCEKKCCPKSDKKACCKKQSADSSKTVK